MNSKDHLVYGNEFYYKIWTLKRGTNKRGYIKEYYPLHMLDKKSNSSYLEYLFVDIKFT